MAMLPMRNKNMDDKIFYPFFDRISEESTDERNYVRKAVNWALRQLGKCKSRDLYEKALKTAREIEKIDDKTARWIAKDAIRELTTSEYVLKRFK